MITCYVIRAGSDESSAPVPEVLAANLARLSGYPEFHQVSMGMVRTGVHLENKILLQMEAGRERFELDLEPVAYDRNNGSLTLARCAFEMGTFLSRSTSAGVFEERHWMSPVFSTSTTVRSDEYTVLGAAGSEPTFVVLQIRSV